MKEKIYNTNKGPIHYWTNDLKKDEITLVLLPGLTADHRLFEKQTEYFKDKYNVFVWDAPGHYHSRPFTLDFDLFDKATWLDEILTKEEITKPIIVGQSMGGYVGQVYSELFKEKLKGYISIDSAPLQREYISSWEIWLLKRMEPVYAIYPWKSLLKVGSVGVAESEYGRNLMRKMMMTYHDDPRYYAKLTGHGYRMLANAYESNCAFELACPTQLICGEKDHAGSCISYSKRWHKKTGLPLAWIKDAGHNSNTDKPEKINELIEDIVQKVNEINCKK